MDCGKFVIDSCCRVCGSIEPCDFTRHETRVWPECVAYARVHAAEFFGGEGTFFLVTNFVLFFPSLLEIFFLLLFSFLVWVWKE